MDPPIQDIEGDQSVGVSPPIWDDGDLSDFLVNQVLNILPEIYADVKEALYKEYGQDMYANYNELFTDHIINNYEHIFNEIKQDFYNDDVFVGPYPVCDLPPPIGGGEVLDVQDVVDFSTDDAEMDILLTAVGEGVETVNQISQPQQQQGVVSTQDVLGDVVEQSYTDII